MFARALPPGRKPTMEVQEAEKAFTLRGHANQEWEDIDETMSTVSMESSIESSIEENLTTVKIPKGFLCPLTMETMYDPVLDAEGNTYERSALLEWLKKERTSPISRQPLSEQMLKPNNALRDSIHEFMGEKWVKAKAAEYTTYERTDTARSKSKYREKINCFLQLVSSEIPGLPSSLNEKGCCAFRHDGITMALDVPENLGVFCLYTYSLVPTLTEPMKDLLLELNFLQSDTRGGCLSVKRNSNGHPEVMFSYTDRVAEITAREFVNIIVNFTETAVLIRNKLCDVR